MKKQSIWKNIRGYFRPDCETVTPEISRKLRLSGKAIRIPVNGYPEFEIEMGKQTLLLCPDPGVTTSNNGHQYDFILFDPNLYFPGIAHIQRLSPGKTLRISRSVEYQEYVFSSPRDAFRRNFSVTHEGNALVFRDPVSELGTYVSLVSNDQEESRITTRRVHALMRILEIYGAPLKPLSADDAIATLREVNGHLSNDAWRRKDSFNNPGGVLELPHHLIPVLVGDLHAQVDNLLTILSENSFMDCLDKGTAALIIIGDSVHPEEKEQAASMDSSLLIMDLIFRMKLRYPRQVFYIVGNHDSFSHDIMKHGVPQGLLWEKHVIKTRGEAYKAELEIFYRQSPLAVVSQDFIACHAGPVRSNISMEVLVNVRQFPEIVHEMTWNRLRTPGFPAGYTRSDVRRFRKNLEANTDTPFIVGHHPCTPDGTLWLDAGHIQHHHIVISSRPDKIGMFTRINDMMVPQIYPPEPLTAWLNKRVAAS